MTESIDEFTKRRMNEFPPYIDETQFPEGERNRIRLLIRALPLLSSFMEAFQNDLDLFDYAERNDTLRMKWAPIACRDAILNLWCFYDALEQIGKALDRCKYLGGTVPKDVITVATQSFDASFPDAVNMRHITAHPAGHLAAKSRKDHSINGTVLIHSSWAGQTVKHSFEGREISFELSDDTVKKLTKIRDGVFSAFRAHRA